MSTAGEIKTTCPYCGVGCGVLAKVAEDGAVTVRGDPEHTANFGRLCSKGSALGETVDLDGRLLFPEIAGRKASWVEALDRVASKFSQAIAEHGPDAVAFYVSGQLLTEDYYVANKLMKGFIGSANIDTNSRLCMASSVAGHRRAFGSDTVPGNYEDLELADLIVLVGSNLAWCQPVLYQRIAAAKESRPAIKVVVIDPRRTATAEIADLHLPIAPDCDGALFAGLLGWLSSAGALDQDYIGQHTSGFDQAIAAAGQGRLADIAAATGLDGKQLFEFFSLFARTERTVTVYSQGVNQSASGTDKVNAIINCHLATGRIGKPGMGPFSVTGQPNAMGGREVGGLANMLAAHMEIVNEAHRDRVRRSWKARRLAFKTGLKAVELFDAVADGRIKALWIMGTNPADSMPRAKGVEAALKACPFVVVSEVSDETDTVRHADVKLPAAAWGEKDGTVTNSERRISRQRPFLPMPGEALPDWKIICDVASRMGFGEHFDFQSSAEIFAEHAALSAFENDGSRAFDIGAFAGIDEPRYDAMAPVQWPVMRRAHTGRERFFGDGKYYTLDRRARFIPTTAVASAPAFDGEFVLNTGRVRDHWHTMTRTGKSQRLSQHLAEPYVEMHPLDAATHAIGDADLVGISNDGGTVVLRALLSARQQRGSIFVPMHWTDQFAANARIDALVSSKADPVSGQPALKQSRARIARFNAAAHGFAVVRNRPAAIEADYWALAKCAGGWRIELAFVDAPADWTRFAKGLFGGGGSGEFVAYSDAISASHRLAAFNGDNLVGALFTSATPVAVSRSWAVEQLVLDHAPANRRYAVVAGRADAGRPDRGATVCSCFGVGALQIADAVRSGCRSVDAIGAALQAGTNCGSCRSEIKAIIDAGQLQAAE